MTTIVHKRGTGIPAADDLAVGEIAIDTSTGTAYTKNNSGEVVPVGGDGGGDSIWTEVPESDSSPYRWVTLTDQATGDDEWGFHIQYSTAKEDPENPDPDFPNGPWDRAEIRLRDIKAYRGKIHTVTADYLVAGNAQVLEQQVLGGIQILGANQERPDESPDEKSIQYALTVGHETLGRTVVIDKEGIIRARDFTDLDGNSIIGGGGDFDNSHAAGDPTENEGCVSVGIEALSALTTAKYNTATGYWAMQNSTTGGFNTATGYKALWTNTFGQYCTAFGYNALYASNGYRNTGIGSNALRNNTGLNNTAVGNEALRASNSNGSDNTAVGNTAGFKILSGGSNTMVGAKAMESNLHGHFNTAVGYGAGANLTGTYNTAIGAGAGPDESKPNVENTTCIGRGAKTAESNTIQLGNENILKVKTYGAIQANNYLDIEGNPVTVSPSAIVEAFTTLRDEIAKEDNAEDAILTLTDTLGDLIRKFEGMSK